MFGLLRKCAGLPVCQGGGSNKKEKFCSVRNSWVIDTSLTEKKEKFISKSFGIVVPYELCWVSTYETSHTGNLNFNSRQHTSWWNHMREYCGAIKLFSAQLRKEQQWTTFVHIYTSIFLLLSASQTVVSLRNTSYIYRFQQVDIWATVPL